MIIYILIKEHLGGCRTVVRLAGARPGSIFSTEKKNQTEFGQAWWCIVIIPALGRLRQEDLEFKASLGCIVDFKAILAT
jgi:uncharacterized protein YceK